VCYTPDSSFLLFYYINHHNSAGDFASFCSFVLLNRLIIGFTQKLCRSPDLALASSLFSAFALWTSSARLTAMLKLRAGIATLVFSFFLITNHRPVLVVHCSFFHFCVTDGADAKSAPTTTTTTSATANVQHTTELASKPRMSVRLSCASTVFPDPFFARFSSSLSAVL
jgi:hypothetical protein